MTLSSYIRRTCTALLVCFLGILEPASAEESDVTVFAAASLADVLEEILEEQELPFRVRTSLPALRR